MEYEAYVSLETGAIHYHSEYGDIEDQLPDDIDDEDKYVAIPHKRYLGLGKHLALSFTETCLPEHIDRVSEMFSRSGAFPRFKELLEAHDQLERWYLFESNALIRAVQQWCEDNGITIEA